VDNTIDGRTRRNFLHAAVGVSGAFLIGAQGKKTEEEEDEGVAPPEDLMREHGVLKRVMLVQAGGPHEGPPRSASAGRRLTDQITHLATAATLKDQGTAKQLRDAMAQFNRMYSPHEAREDTVLFPALRSVVSKHEFAALGEDFEKKEHDLFGEDGFEKMVDRVAGIEKRLNIYELSQFTPR
jgi:hemerythrin-like domain-containing protein